MLIFVVSLFGFFDGTGNKHNASMLVLAHLYSGTYVINKSEWVRFQGKQLFLSIFFHPSQLGSTLKGKNLLLLEQILSFKIRHLLKRLGCLRK